MRTAFVALGLLVPLTAGADILTGTARNAKGDTVYIERHKIQKDESGFNKHISVEYEKPGGKLFATMTSDFSKSKLVPNTTFEDQRFNSKYTLRLLDQSVEFEKFKNDVSTSKKSVSLKNLMVASQGFDNFIRTYSSKLAIEPQSFYFGVLNQMDFYSLTGFTKPSSSDDQLEYGIRASSWILRMFTSEIKVTYDAKTFRLKSFTGRSNILNDQGESQNVIIAYDWKEEAQ